MMNALDYYQNKNILSAIRYNLIHIRNESEKEDCRQEVFAELYNVMPLDEAEAIRLVHRVARKFKRGLDKITKNEMNIDEYRI